MFLGRTIPVKKSIGFTLLALITALGIGALFIGSANGSVASAQAGNNGGNSRFTNMNPDQRALAFVYYKAIRTCFAQETNLENFALNTISAQGAQNYTWFYSGPLATYEVNVGLIGDQRPNGDGRHRCYGTDEGVRVAKELVRLTGYESGSAFLCAIGFTRQSESTNTTSRCPIVSGVTNDFLPPSNVPQKLDEWWRNTVGATSLNASGLGPGQYILYYRSFIDSFNPCGVEEISASSTDYDYRIYGPAPDGKSLIPKNYIITDSGKNRQSNVQLYDQTGRSCEDLVAQIAVPEGDGARPSSVSEYTSWLVASPGNTYSSQPNTDEVRDATTGSTCVVEGVGWIVCPIMNALGGLSDAMYGWISSVLTLNPLQQTDPETGDTSPQYETWQVVRNLANVVLVIAFLIIIFSQLTGAGISNYGVKKMLPRLILVAIAINLSFLLMQVAIDLTNLLGVGIKVILDSTAVLDVTQDVNFQNVTEALLTGLTTVAVGGTAFVLALNAGSSVSTLALLALPFIVTAALSLFAAIATLFLRNALVIVLAIISPLAFAAYLLPNTQELFNKWRKLFVSMLLLFPMAALLFGGANFAAYVVLSSGQPFSVVIALFLIAAPLGALPFLVRSSNSILSGVGNRLQGLAKAARNPLQRSLQGRIDNQREKYRAGERNWLGRRRNPDDPGARRTLGQRGAARKQTLENETSAMKEAGARRYKEMAEDPGRTDRTTRRARTNIDRLATEKAGNSAADSIIAARQQARAATDGTPDARFASRSFDASEASRVAASQIETRNKARLENNEASTVNGLGLGDQSTLARAATETAKATQGRIDNRESRDATVMSAIQDQKSNQVYADEISSEADRTFAQTTEQDAGLSQSIQSTKAAKQESDTIAKEQEALFVTHNKDEDLDLRERTASEEISTANSRGEARFEEIIPESQAIPAGSPLAGVISRARTARSEGQTAKSRVDAAKDVASEERIEQILDPQSGLADRMAGIGGPERANLEIARAYEAQRKSDDTEIAAYKVRFREEGVATKVAQGPVLDPPGTDSLLGRVVDTTRGAAEREAAAVSVVEGGDIESITPLVSYLWEQRTDVGQRQTQMQDRVRQLEQRQAQGLPNAPGELDMARAGLAAANEELESVISLQKAVGEKIASSPGKPMALGAAEVAALRTGTAERPTRPPRAAIPSVAGLQPMQVQTLTSVINRGVSPSGFAAMDQLDIRTITDLARMGALPPDRRDTLLASLNSVLAPGSVTGENIKDRERGLLEDLRTQLTPIGPAPGP